MTKSVFQEYFNGFVEQVKQRLIDDEIEDQINNPESDNEEYIEALHETLDDYVNTTWNVELDQVCADIGIDTLLDSYESTFGLSQLSSVDKFSRSRVLLYAYMDEKVQGMTFEDLVNYKF